jgi:hypothetical protein
MCERRVVVRRRMGMVVAGLLGGREMVVTVLAERAVPEVRVRERRISRAVGRWPS